MILFALLTVPAAAQSFDVKLLDRLGANASNATNVTLNKSTLRLAANFLGDDEDGKSLRALVRNLNAIYVRVYSFDGPGQFHESDLDAFRAWLGAPGWERIVETKSKQESSEVFVRQLQGDMLGGVAIISTAPREVTVVFIDGPIKEEDVGKLSGTMGIPDINSIVGIPKKKK